MSADPSQMSDLIPSSRPGAREWWLLTLIFLTGVALRVAWPARMAVEHFDEGVYASNIFFSGETGDERYPDQHLYAPPLVPLLIEFSMLVLGPSNVAAMVPSLVAGCLTIPLVWWVGRRWFGPTAGLGAAALAALNDVHIWLSRTALTDVLLCFWLLAAVHLFWVALTGRNRLALVAAGGITGLAWWTKYSGWLPLAIGLAGVVPWRLFGDWPVTSPPQRGPRISISKRVQGLAGPLLGWGSVALIAFLVWAPCLWSLQDHGGYASVMANHRGYMVGLAGWFDSLHQQSQKLGVLDGWPSLHAPLFAAGLCLLYDRLSGSRSTWNTGFAYRTALVGTAVVGGLSLLAGSSLFLGAGALAGIAVVLLRSPASPVASRLPSPTRFAAWLVAAWFLGTFLTTPLYTPFPRLTLPWLTACWLGAGAFFSRFARFPGGPVIDPGTAGSSTSSDANTNGEPSFLTGAQKSSLALVLAAVAVVGVGLEPFAIRRGVPGWKPRTGRALAVPELMKAVERALSRGTPPDLESFAIYTYGDPACLFQCRLAGVRWVRPVQNLDFARPDALPPRLPSFVVLGPRARRTPGFADGLQAVKNRLPLIQVVPVTQSRLVALDEADSDDGPRPVVLELYRIE